MVEGETEGFQFYTQGLFHLFEEGVRTILTRNTNLDASSEVVLMAMMLSK
jgi:hypothetical protein